MKFAIDQQPYLQGYIPVAVLAIMKKEKTTDLAKVTAAPQEQPEVQGPPRPSTASSRSTARATSARDPGFVTKDNIAKVEKYAGQYR